MLRQVARVHQVQLVLATARQRHVAADVPRVLALEVPAPRPENDSNKNFLRIQNFDFFKVDFSVALRSADEVMNQHKRPPARLKTFELFFSNTIFAQDIFCPKTNSLQQLLL